MSFSINLEGDWSAAEFMTALRLSPPPSYATKVLKEWIDESGLKSSGHYLLYQWLLKLAR